MISRYLLFLLILIPFGQWAQIGPPQIIDSSANSVGTTQLHTAYLNQDSLPEVLASFTGTNGHVGFYTNMGQGQFSSLNIIDSLAFCKGVAAGDFDQNGQTDLVAIGGIGMEVRLYYSTAGNFGAPIQLDSNISIQVNDVVVADFDGNQSDDIVIIGQHSIDFFRNDGTGQFNKEAILTTGTSPRQLECLDLAVADMDLDGDLDLVTAETAGLVVYTNSGNAQFTPHYYSIIPEVGWVIHPFDINGDGYKDVIMRTGSGQVKWFRNNTTDSLIFEATLTALPSFQQILSIDMNLDGRLDLYGSYQNSVSVFLNDSSHSFNQEVAVHQDNFLIMGPLALGPLESQGRLDYCWGGVNGTIAFHRNQNGMGSQRVSISRGISVFPNPVQQQLHFSEEVSQLSLGNAQGEVLLQEANTKLLNISHFPTGVYWLKFTAKGRDGIITKKIVKH